MSGNGGYGIQLDGADANVVAGNYIGTDATGSAALPNAGGVVMSRANGNTIGVGNVISGNSDVGVGVEVVGVGIDATETIPAAGTFATTVVVARA